MSATQKLALLTTTVHNLVDLRFIEKLWKFGLDGLLIEQTNNQNQETLGERMAFSDSSGVMLV